MNSNYLSGYYAGYMRKQAVDGIKPDADYQPMSVSNKPTTAPANSEQGPPPNNLGNSSMMDQGALGQALKGKSMAATMQAKSGGDQISKAYRGGIKMPVNQNMQLGGNALGASMAAR